jgi:hypothetical protein
VVCAAQPGLKGAFPRSWGDGALQSFVGSSCGPPPGREMDVSGSAFRVNGRFPSRSEVKLQGFRCGATVEGDVRELGSVANLFKKRHQEPVELVALRCGALEA